MDRGRTNTARKIPGAHFINTALAALVLPIWLLALLAWAVQLAGVSAVQRAQGGRYLQFDWFVTAFELVVLLMMPVHVLARRSTPGILAIKAVVTVLEILRTNVWNDARLGRNLLGQNTLRVDSLTNPGLTASAPRVNLLFSGYLIMSFFNCLLIISLGNLPAWSGQDVEYLSRKGKQGVEHMESDHAHTHTGAGHRNGLPSDTTGNTARSTLPAGANGNHGHGATQHVPHTHLNETRQNDGLAGKTYLDGNQSTV